MQTLSLIQNFLYDDTGKFAGILGVDGKEYLIASQENRPNVTGLPVIYNPASVAITGGTITNITVFSTPYTDSSGTPGNVTNNDRRGKAAFAAGGGSVVVTSSICQNNSCVFVQLGGADATLKSVVVTPSNGSFTVTGNALATGITPFVFFIVG